jgi:hypothetical protein
MMLQGSCQSMRDFPGTLQFLSLTVMNLKKEIDCHGFLPDHGGFIRLSVIPKMSKHILSYPIVLLYHELKECKYPYSEAFAMPQR